MRWTPRNDLILAIKITSMEAERRYGLDDDDYHRAYVLLRNAYGGDLKRAADALLDEEIRLVWKDTGHAEEEEMVRVVRQ